MIVVKVPKAKRFHSVKETNIGKVEAIKGILQKVEGVKNQMSMYVKIHLQELGLQLFENKELFKQFISEYKIWNSSIPELPAHTIQTLFQDIVALYRNQTKVIINNFKKELNNKSNNKELTKKLYSLIKIALTKNELPDDSIIESIVGNCSEVKLKVVKDIVSIYIQKFKRKIGITFKSGSFRLTNSGYSFEIVFDKENSKFQYFIKLKLKGTALYIPIQINNKYHTSLQTNTYKKQLFIVDTEGKSIHRNKLYFVLVKDEKLKFSEFGKLVGCDVNLTNETFITPSDPSLKPAQYDTELLEQYFKFLEEIDKVGYQHLNAKQKFKLKKWTKRIEHHLEFIIANFVNELKRAGITDIVLEDLDSFKSGKFKFTFLGKKFTLNRFTKLLRLTGLKQIFIRICRNRGIRVHLIHSRYTSQQCSKCGHISKKNRKSQSVFKCEKCGYSPTNADYNASINILYRLLFEGYRKVYLKFDKQFGEFRPKSKEYKPSKSLLESEHQKLVNNYQIDVLSGFLMVEFQSPGSPPIFKLFNSS